MRERIKNLLIGGLKPSEITSIVGCTPAYVSQLLKEDSFREEVQNGMIAAASDKKEDEHLDVRYQNTEHKLLTAMEGAMGEASLGEISRALEVVGRRRDIKRAPVIPAGATYVQNVISLTLPMHAIQNHIPAVALNAQREIIAIDAKPLAPMSSTGVKNLFAQLAQRKQQEIELTAEDF